ncbi:hypothetical protein DYJ25_02020 [Prevotella denticola]|nr:hypothetical protein DYJ25_02020 [Prevotella denticola]
MAAVVFAPEYHRTAQEVKSGSLCIRLHTSQTFLHPMDFWDETDCPYGFPVSQGKDSFDREVMA